MLIQACPDCSRQYDVTHLDPGREVRCACGSRIAVVAVSALPVQALRCTHCGGAVGSADPECPYCGAKLEEADRRATTLCPSCWTRLEDDSNHCRACGTEIAPQALTPIPAGRVCPRCEGKLANRDLGPADVIECSACSGLWLAAGTFEKVCDTARRDASVSFPGSRPVEQATQVEVRVSYIPCVTCEELMVRKQFRHGGGNSRVVVDFCREHGVWLDAAELENIVAFLRSVDGGAAPAVPRHGYLVGDPPPRRERPEFESRRSWGEVLGERGEATSLFNFLGHVLTGLF